MASHSPEFDVEVSAAELAWLLKVDRSTIENLVTEGMPKLTRGRFSLAACLPWYLQREIAAARATRPLNDLDQARKRKTEAEAARAEEELARIRREQVSIAAVKLEWAQMAQRMRAQLLAAPGRYSPRTASLATLVESQQAWADAMRDVIRELRDG